MNICYRRYTLCRRIVQSLHIQELRSLSKKLRSLVASSWLEYFYWHVLLVLVLR
jgi:hypothetical protein